MTELVAYLLLFLAVGFGFIFVHLVAGRIVRPTKPDPEKLTIYECGEPTIGSAWIQFDLRFYVVALLFVIFDVEVAFFFPWAVVFGKANTLADPNLPVERRQQLTSELVAGYRAGEHPVTQQGEPIRTGVAAPVARQIAWIAFVDILVFFGVLLVGFAYLWKRGDLDWVRSVMAERSAALPPEPGAPAPPAPIMVGAGQDAW
jgi:NADH-quinone oxidoreductase subunit A